MSTPALICDLADHEGKSVRLRGWIYGKRSGGKIVFLQLRDGTGLCQCIIEACNTACFKVASEASRESSVTIEGEIRKDDRAIGGFECAVTSMDIMQTAEDYPITPKAHGIDFLMSHRHLWLRSRRPTAIMRIRHTFIGACRHFFDSRGFTLVDTPILSPGAGEDTQTLFNVDYFGDEVYLAQTGQLYLESACMALGKVYCFGPTFRAEKSKTRRHLTEFWMIEPEVAFAELDDVIELAEAMVYECIQAVLRDNEEDLLFLDRDIEMLRKISRPFGRITYSEAVDRLRSAEIRGRLEAGMEEDRRTLQSWMEQLQEHESRVDSLTKAWQREKLLSEIQELRENIGDLEQDLENRPSHIELAQNFEWGKDLGGSDETILAREFDNPVFVTHYPAEAKAFYMKRCDADPRVVLNMDLLAPEGYGEIIGGSQREDRLDRLEAAIRAKALDPEDYGWYLDLRRFGSVPHGGFGLGIERTLSWICGLKHVRETIPFPRTMGRIYP